MDAAADQKQERIGVLEELLSERFSCRAFQPQNVARPTIERILNAAQKTASWCNSQPWRLEITSGTATSKFRDVMYLAASSGRRSSASYRIVAPSADVARGDLIPVLPLACADGRSAGRASREAGYRACAIPLKRLMFSVMATSVGRRSMLEAPKKPTTPSVRSST